ncbi:MAG: hypothetical protein RR141_05835 [Rikenellaceae bacterium]
MFGFNNKKPRQFNYKPRFYNPEEEERERRRRLSGIEIDAPKNEKYIPGSLIKQGRVQRMTITEEEKSLKDRSSMIRLIIFMVLLAIAAYFLITFTGFETIVRAFRGE